MQRYSRNILLIGNQGQTKLLNSRVLICGCGGLGSTVIMNLAGSGVGTIGLIDDDVVEVSNLNRQFIHKNIGEDKVTSAKKRILEYNPEITVNTYKIRLDENNYQSIVKDYDIIIDCFDSYKSKILLNDIAVETGKTLIHGGVTEYFGQVTVIKPSTPCLRCIFPDIDLGKEVPKGILSPVVSTVASIQSMEAVKQILNTGEPLEGLLLTYNALTNDFKKLKITKNTACKCYKKI